MTDLKNPIVFTANRLHDGVSVWLGQNGCWVEEVGLASVAHTTVDQSALLEVALLADANNTVVEPYEIDIVVEQGVITPTKFRERIRAAGPTVRLDLGIQARLTSRAA